MQDQSLLGQAKVLQGTLSEIGPRYVQFLPPAAGKGLLHGRRLVLAPPPHVLLHDPKFDQEPYPPSTKIIAILCCSIFSESNILRFYIFTLFLNLSL